MNAPAPAPSLSDRLRGVMVSMRGELDVSRHVFRAGPAYVVRDPVTFQTHRFDPEDYKILNAIERNKTLGETFEKLVSLGQLDAEDEEGFYGFILELHQRNLLSLPVSDGDTLYKRFERRRQAERMSKVMGIFFLRVPVLNPDRLLARTIGVFGWLFTLPALIAWLALSGFAGFIAYARWDELTAPVLTVFDGSNMFMLWGTLIGLKVIHEFGHAYAVKKYGGHVPEMGAFFVLFTPLAYVDATDSWTFTKTRHRAIVTLGGVYVESIVGGIAMIVWAMTETSTLNTLAYQIVLLATVTTALFNLNPLLRYDAYYLVSDLTGVPNLRARCQVAVSNLLKRRLYGLKSDLDGDDLRHHPGLVLFGSAQLAYKVTIMVTITTVLIMKFGFAGIVLAFVLVGLSLGKAVIGLFQYILTSDEMLGRRLRGLTVSAGGILTTLAVAALVPIPWPIDSEGVVSAEYVRTVNAPNDGIIVRPPLNIGATIHAGDVIVELKSSALVAARNTLAAETMRGRADTLRASFESRPEGLLAYNSEAPSRAQLASAQSDVDGLRVVADRNLRVTDVFERRAGVRVSRGDPILRVTSGRPEAVFYFRTFDYEALRLQVGDTVACRLSASPDEEIMGRVVHIASGGSRDLGTREGDLADRLGIPVNPGTGEASEPYFEIRLDMGDHDAPFENSTVRARFPAESRTTARILERRFTRFMNRVKEGFSAQ